MIHAYAIEVAWLALAIILVLITAAALRDAVADTKAATDETVRLFRMGDARACVWRFVIAWIFVWFAGWAVVLPPPRELGKFWAWEQILVPRVLFLLILLASVMAEVSIRWARHRMFQRIEEQRMTMT